MSFITAPWVPTGKQDRFQVLAGQEPFHLTAHELNEGISQHMLDLRTQLVAGTHLGLADRAARPPMPPGGSPVMIWSRSDGQLVHSRSTIDRVVAAGQVAAKGDLLVWDGTGWVVLPAGANGRVLAANSGTASGLEWVVGGGGGSVDGLLGAYEAASSAARNILGLSAGDGPVLIRDNVAPLVSTLFAVQDNAGAIDYLSVQAGVVTMVAENVGTTLDDFGLSLVTDAAATVGVQVQRTPGIALRGSGWDVDGAVSVLASWVIQGRPVAGNSVDNLLVFSRGVGGSVADAVAFGAGTVGPSVTQQHALPAVASDTFALLAATQTLTNKTIGSGWTLDQALALTDGVDVGDATHRATLFADLVTIPLPAQGTSPTAGLVLNNDTAAANNAPQYSPVIRLRGHGWSTASGGSSQESYHEIFSGAVQTSTFGFATPTGTKPHLRIMESSNGAAAAQVLLIEGSGTATGVRVGAGLNGLWTNGANFYVGAGLGNNGTMYYLSGAFTNLFPSNPAGTGIGSHVLLGSRGNAVGAISTLISQGRGNNGKFSSAGAAVLAIENNNDNFRLFVGAGSAGVADRELCYAEAMVLTGANSEVAVGDLVLYAGSRTIDLSNVQDGTAVAGVALESASASSGATIRVARKGRVYVTYEGTVNAGDMLTAGATNGTVKAQATPAVGTLVGVATENGGATVTGKVCADLRL